MEAADAPEDRAGSRRGLAGAEAAGLGLLARRPGAVPRGFPVSRDVGHAPPTLPHDSENTGTGGLVHLGMFEAPVYRNAPLNGRIAALAAEPVRQHLGLGGATPAAIPEDDLGIVPPGAG